MAGIASVYLQADWEKTLVAAKEEGKVVVSIPANAELRRRAEEVFEGRFAGIELEPVAGTGSKNVRRISDAFKEGTHPGDKVRS